jgi:hypothetical protein
MAAQEDGMNPLRYIQPFFAVGSAEWSDGWYHGFTVGAVTAICGILLGLVI